MQRAVFLGCSRRKTLDANLLPAIERYDGPCFRVLRRYLRDEIIDVPQVWILSARFGLLSAEQRIPSYEESMSPKRANELRSAVFRVFLRSWQSHPFKEAFVNLGANYARVMSACWVQLPERVRVQHASGSIGGRCSQLHAWLRGEADSEIPDIPNSYPVGRATLQGVTIEIPPEDVMKLARNKFAVDRIQAERWQTWYVPLGEQRVAPKWLVSALTGLSVSCFRTSDACRFLSALGIRVLRK